MQEEARKSRNEAKLVELLPELREKFRAVLTDLEGHGFRPRIQEAYRSPEDQHKAYLEGRSRLLRGWHQRRAACDILDDDRPLQPSTMYLLMLAAAAEAHGLETGIRWGLPPNMRQRIDNLIAAKAWTETTKVGFDPCHVEPGPELARQLKMRKDK